MYVIRKTAAKTGAKYWPKMGATLVQLTDKNLKTFKTETAAQKYLSEFEICGEVARGENLVTNIEIARMIYK